MDKKIKIGEIVNVAGIDHIVLDVLGDNVLCLTRDFAYEGTIFDDDSNNYAKSSIRRMLNSEYLDKLSAVVGEENIIPAEINLTSDDGLDDYGKVTDKVGLLTADMYRKYNRIIEQYPVNVWWWLSTPWSTPHRGYRFSVRVVYGGGTLFNSVCYREDGVRPFCIFSSSIF